MWFTKIVFLFKNRVRQGQYFLYISCFVILLLIPAVVFSQENNCSFGGYLWGTDAIASFEVFVDNEEVALAFEWPVGSVDFWVTATGENRDEILIDQSLNDGDMLTLSGPGIYYFKLRSHWGSGCWKADVIVQEKKE
jgi:hypothetical protein